MSSKQLTAEVRLNISDAEKKLKILASKINKIDDVVNKQSYATRGISAGFDKAAISANKFDKNVKKSANSVSLLTKKVKLLVSAYAGIMGVRAVLNTSDNITRAKNQLNNLPGGNPNRTQETMDKAYAAAIRSRSSYADMLSNVGKTMTLAPEAFQNNEDNAIKFQEIMAKSYALGNKSAAEQSSSMYQLVQALGSGVLQGDELRSVREGATLAYKKIEDFAKGIYGAEENLKDLASQGKITSDLVVAAILDAENEINKAFENTNMTFADAWENITSTATKAFEPVLTMLNEALNSDVGKAIINGIGNAITIVANIILHLFNLIKMVYQFVVDNWNLVHSILTAIGTAITIYLIYKMILFIYTIAIALWRFAFFVAVAIDYMIRFGVAAASAFLGVNLWLWIVIAVIAILIGVVAYLADSFVDACGIIIGWLHVLGATALNVVIFILNMFIGLFSSIFLTMQNIGIAINNVWQSAKASFWEWVSECLNGTSLVAKAISKIAKLFGLDTVSIDTKINAAKGKILPYNGKETYAAAFNAIPYKNLTDSYNKGYARGTAGGEWLTGKFNTLKDKLGVGSLPDPNDPAYNVGGIGNGYDPTDALKGIDGIKDNTGKIADSMDLTNEDLEYLRRIADMEWKKEYTTAEVKIEMNNNNQINGDSDLDGIVTRLSDKLYEELNVVANGVYAY